MSNLSEAEKYFKKGLNDLKVSYLSLKFSPDYLSAITNFEKSAKIYEDNKKIDLAITSYLKAIECNKKLLESWAEGMNYLKIAELFFFQKNDTENGFKYLREAQVSFKLAGKYHTSLKILTDLSLKLKEYSASTMINEYSKISLRVLQEAWDDSVKLLDNDMIKVSIDDLFSKLFDLLLSDENFSLMAAKKLLDDYTGILVGDKTTKKHKILNAYAKNVMLHLIQKDFDTSNSLKNKARLYSDSSTLDDITDMEVLIESFKDKNNKKFNYQLTYAYHLFERNILKQLKISFDKYMSEGSKSEDYLGDDDKDMKLKQKIDSEKAIVEEKQDNPEDYI